jgi:NTP pyrophosphatase (non-canonical NTP hydrolase)
MSINDKPMSLDEYQTKAGEFQLPSAPPEERVMGLLEEAGEVAGLFKRLMRGDYTPDVVATKLHKELGDILWYLSRVAADNNWTLQDIAESNIEKLESRKVRNLIMGEGGER